jgi:hypothetical protein
MNKDMKALAFAADDNFHSLLGADLVRVSKNKGANFFAGMAVPLSKLDKATQFEVRLEVGSAI